MPGLWGEEAEGALCLRISLFITELKNILFQAEFYAFVNKSRLGKGKNQPVCHRVSTCLRLQPQQRGLQMSVLILTMLLLWPLSQGEAVMLCSSPLGQGLGCKYVCQDTQVRDEEGKGSIQGILTSRVTTVGSCGSVCLRPLEDDIE